MEIADRVDLRRCRVGPRQPEGGEPGLHGAEREARFLAQRLGAGLPVAHDALRIGTGAAAGFRPARDHERALRSLPWQRVAEGEHGGLRRPPDLGTDVGARDGIDRAARLVDAPRRECLAVELVEGLEARVRELPRRAQFARAECRQRPPGRLDVLRRDLEAFGERLRRMQEHPLDDVAGLGGCAGGILEHRRDVGVVAGCEQARLHKLPPMVHADRGVR